MKRVPHKETFAHHCDAVTAATKFDDLLVEGEEPEATYKAFAKVLHPDAVDDRFYDEATSSVTRLNTLWDEYNGKNVGASGPKTITTKKRTYVLSGDLIEGSVANLYLSAYREDDKTANAWLKMPRSPKDSDLLDREVKALKSLDSPDYRHFAPTLIETFRHKDAATNTIRRVNAIEPLTGFYSVAEIKEAYPQGLDPKDVAWMWRRLFVACGLAYDNGLVHGAITPENVMVHPAMHGVVLIDWCYSCRDDQTIPALVPGRRGMYPPSVFDKKPPTHAVDVAMAAQTMKWLMGDKLTRPFSAFARGCAVSSPPKPSELLGEFDELIDRLWGPRKYRAFEMPPT